MAKRISNIIINVHYV